MTDSTTAPATSPTSPVQRYRCTSCGNLTRFDVTSTRRTQAFHHFTVGGELEVEEERVLSETIEDVVCRWCGTSANVVTVDEPGPVDGERGTGTERAPGEGS